MLLTSLNEIAIPFAFAAMPCTETHQSEKAKIMIKKSDFSPQYIPK